MMSNDHSVDLDELSEPATALVEKIEAALSSLQPQTEIRTWYRRGEQRWVEEQTVNFFSEYVKNQWRRYLL